MESKTKVNSKFLMTEHYNDLLPTLLALFRDYRTYKEKVLLDGKSLSIVDIAQAFDSNIDRHFDLEEGAKEEMVENAQFIQEYLEMGNVVYGANTGFGGSADVRTPKEVVCQQALIDHTNSGFGEKMDFGLVRAFMIVRANSLAHAYTGSRPEIANLICEMVNRDIIPEVPLRGTISSSGDLLPLSYLALCMNGSRPTAVVKHKGKITTVSEAFKNEGLKFVQFHAKEALAIINAASVAASLASNALFTFGPFILLSQIITAMSVESLKGRTQSFHPTVVRCLNHSGNKEFAGNVLDLLNGSNFARELREKVIIKFDNQHGPDNIAQDRYTLRTSPQWLGPGIETYKESLRRLHVEINSSNDNPIVDHREREIVHAGNFQGSSTTVAMDQTRQSIQMCARIMFAQMTEMINETMSQGLSPNLSGCDYTIDFGFKGVDISLAAYVSELEFITGPMSNHVISAEMHNQSVNSMALVSARMTTQALMLYQMICAASLACVCQAVDLRWLEKKVEHLWENIVGGSEEASKIKPIRGWKWYDAAFRFDEVKDLIHQSLQRIPNDKFEKLSIDNVIVNFKSDIALPVQQIYKQEHVDLVASCLGQGTRQMYLHVRKTIGIRFNNGTEATDLSLDKIFKNIQSPEFIDLLINIFESKIFF